MLFSRCSLLMGTLLKRCRMIGLFTTHVLRISGKYGVKVRLDSKLCLMFQSLGSYDSCLTSPSQQFSTPVLKPYSHYWCFSSEESYIFLFAHDFSDGLNPHGVTRPSFHLTFDSRKPCFSLHGVCVVQPDWGSSSISASYESSSPGLARSLCRAGKRACPSGHKSTGKASLCLQRVGFPPVIYSPHRDEVRHGHCLCTWAFIKRPGWALCRRHSNVQGAD